MESEIKLYQGDCLEIMKDIADKSVDMILCDLPYGTTACKWDNVIPFEPLWEQYNRIIKDNGAIVLFGSEPFSSLLIASNINNFREEIVWLKNKSGSGLQSKQKHIKIHEKVLIFSKKAKYIFNPQKWLVAEKEFLTQRKTFNEVYVGNNIYSKMYKKQKIDSGERNPLSIVSCKVPFNTSHTKKYSNEIEVRLHPTQKPVALLEYLIKTYTNEGKTVLDNCMGSGSTGVACVNTNRNFIGIELDEKYFNIAKERIYEQRKSEKY
jgi:site-specific DNA-methyltransferase (adenine-specific)